MTITTPLLCPSEAVLNLLRRSYKFIPTPSGCCHGSILRGLDNFLRKYKWHFIFSHRSGRSVHVSNRFCTSSTREPPSDLVPIFVRRRCARIRQVVLSKLRSCSSCYPGDNLPVSERDVLDALRSEKRFFVSPVDKGGGWLVVPVDEYRDEAFRQLHDDKFYTVCVDSLSHGTAAKLCRLLQHLYSNKFINKRELDFLIPPVNPQQRRFYLLPKLHKSDWPSPMMPPGRPIVSDVGSVSRNCASLVEFFLAPIARQLPSYVRDSMHVIAKIKDFSLPENDGIVRK